MDKTFDLSGRRILVTGAAGHIGRVLVHALSERGAAVIALDRQALSDDLAERCVHTISVDLADTRALEVELQALVGAGEPLDGLVHAAAYVGTSKLEGWLGGLEMQSRATFDAALNVNLGAAFTLVQQLLPLLNHASLVFLSSIYGEQGPDLSLYEDTAMDNPAAYGASKAALQQFSRYLATRYGEQGLRANAIVLGGVWRAQDERFVERYQHRTPLGRMARETDLVGPVVFLLSDASAYVTGTELCVDGGYTAL